MSQQHEELNKALVDLQAHLDTEAVRLMKQVVSIRLETVKSELIDYPTQTNSGRAMAWRDMQKALEQKPLVDKQEDLSY